MRFVSADILRGCQVSCPPRPPPSTHTCCPPPARAHPTHIPSLHSVHGMFASRGLAAGPLAMGRSSIAVEATRTRQISITSCLRVGFARTPEDEAHGMAELLQAFGWAWGRLRRWSGVDWACGSCSPAKTISNLQAKRLNLQCEEKASHSRVNFHGTLLRTQSSCSIMYPGRCAGSNHFAPPRLSAGDDDLCCLLATCMLDLKHARSD